MTQTLYLRDGTGFPCGPGTRRNLEFAKGSSGTSTGLLTELTWNYQFSEEQLFESDNWTCFFNFSLTGSTGSPTVRVVVEVYDSSCALTQTIFDDSRVVVSSSQNFGNVEVNEFVVRKNDYLVLRIQETGTSGDRHANIRYNGTFTTEDSRIDFPDSSPHQTGLTAHVIEAFPYCDEDNLPELHSLHTFDGNSLYFNRNSNVRFRVFGNYGAPATDWITQRGYRQHGVTEVDYFLGPRVVSVDLYRDPAHNRQAYWDARLALIDFLRPNRGGPMTFTVQHPNGNTYSLTVRADPGLVFPPEENADWNILERLDFMAFDPLWFGALKSIEGTAAGANADELVFPITFPIWFGGDSTDSLGTGAIDYNGTWETFPTLVLTGPYDSAIIENGYTGAIIELVSGIFSGQTRTITLTPGQQDIVDVGGVSHFNELSADSDLVNFKILPDPLSAVIGQFIQVTYEGSTSQSGFEVQYREKFIGI